MQESMRKVRAIPKLFQGYASKNPKEEFWQQHLDLALQRATMGTFQKEKVLRHRLLGHLNEEELESRLRALGETDMIHWTPSFGKIFHAFFCPSKPLQAEIQLVERELNLLPAKYSALHCRVRHPKAVPKGTKVKGKYNDSPADKTGLPWEGQTRLFAIETATLALQTLTIKLLDNIIQQVCHDRSDIKKCRRLDPLFTVNRQEDGAASAKRGSTTRLLSLSCRSTKAIGISFSSFRVSLREGF